jgi:hypothetical protein
MRHLTQGYYLTMSKLTFCPSVVDIYDPITEVPQDAYLLNQSQATMSGSETLAYGLGLLPNRTQSMESLTERTNMLIPKVFSTHFGQKLTSSPHYLA